jgi:hypothetical protein
MTVYTHGQLLQLYCWTRKLVKHTGLAVDYTTYKGCKFLSFGLKGCPPFSAIYEADVKKKCKLQISKKIESVQESSSIVTVALHASTDHIVFGSVRSLRASHAHN